MMTATRAANQELRPLPPISVPQAELRRQAFEFVALVSAELERHGLVLLEDDLERTDSESRSSSTSSDELLSPFPLDFTALGPFHWLGRGAYRTVFLDERTGLVWKLLTSPENGSNRWEHTTAKWLRKQHPIAERYVPDFELVTVPYRGGMVELVVCDYIPLEAPPRGERMMSSDTYRWAWQVGLFDLHDSNLRWHDGRWVIIDLGEGVSGALDSYGTY